MKSNIDKGRIVTCNDLLERGESSHGHGERKDKEKRSDPRGGHPVKTQTGADGLNDTVQERVVEDHLGKKKQSKKIKVRQSKIRIKSE